MAPIGKMDQFRPVLLESRNFAVYFLYVYIISDRAAHRRLTGYLLPLVVEKFSILLNHHTAHRKFIAYLILIIVPLIILIFN